jgi:archaellum biogenesis protein FlaJ (TadC family)
MTEPSRFLLRLTGLSAFSGVAAFMTFPLVKAGLLGEFGASLTAIAVVMPLLVKFTAFSESLDLEEYREVRSDTQIFLDLGTTVLSGVAAGVFVLTLLFRTGVTPPVPTAVAAVTGVYIGYTGFIMRNSHSRISDPPGGSARTM